MSKDLITVQIQKRSESDKKSTAGGKECVGKMVCCVRFTVVPNRQPDDILISLIGYA